MKQPAVYIHKLIKQYDGVTALDDVSLEVRPGEFFGLLGPNGAGKSTLINILAGPTRRTSGRVEVFGYDVTRDYRRTRSLIGVVPQELVYDHYFTVEKSLRYHSGYFGIADGRVWCEELLRRLDLWEQRRKNINQLSGGMKRRLLVAKALVHKPQVLILDEPTAGVDVTLRRSFWEFIREIHQGGTTVILTTHYLIEAEDHCDRIAILDQGRVVAMDSRENLLSQVGKKQVIIDLCEPLPHPLGPVEGQTAGFERGGKRVTFQIDPRCGELNLWLEALRATGVEIADITLRTPDLEDVFFKLTGAGATGTAPDGGRGEERP